MKKGHSSSLGFSKQKSRLNTCSASTVTWGCHVVHFELRIFLAATTGAGYSTFTGDWYSQTTWLGMATGALILIMG